MAAKTFQTIFPFYAIHIISTMIQPIEYLIICIFITEIIEN